MKQDPRGLQAVRTGLKENRRRYHELSPREKESFDKESLENPYSDSRILNGERHIKIKTILAGIDMDTSEILMAERLRERGEPIDLILSHHPSGRAYADIYQVMDMQADILNRYGVPINVAEGILKKRIKEVSHKLMPANHFRTVHAAKLLGFPLMCIHTPADNCVASFLQKYFNRKRPRYLRNVVDNLREIPEYSMAHSMGVGPKILAGNPESRAGKVFVDMTGGTEGSVEAMEKLTSAGVGTIVGMHLSDKHLESAEKCHLNVVIAGHISSDSVGLNLILNRVIKRFGLVKIIPCSGFLRINQ